MSNARNLKAYVRIDGSGRIVPTSLVLRKNMPKVGKWTEVTAWECCNGSSTTTTTTTTSGYNCLLYVAIGTPVARFVLSYTDCDGVVQHIMVSDPFLFCAQENAYSFEGTVLLLGPCVSCATYEISITEGAVTLHYTDCNQQAVTTELTGPYEGEFCAIPGTIAIEGSAEVTLVGEGCLTTSTTTTTATPTTTTTTTL
jgi:hypothetical protein